MKNLFKSLFICLTLFLGAASASFGQTALTQTSLSGAVTATQNSITLASVTGVAANTVLFIEDGTSGNAFGLTRSQEAMIVVSVPASGTTVQVIRGYDATIPTAHITGALVLLGPATAFNEVEPAGSCTAAQTLYTPYVDLRTGNQWLCSTIKGSWVPGFWNSAASQGVSAAVASASALTPSGPLFHVTGTTAITSFGSAVGMGGTTSLPVGAPFCIIPDALGSTTAGNNIALGTTFVVNKILCFTFDQTNSKYVPSY